MDDQKMKQVLINLLYNSIESMPNGGDISIDTYREVTSKDSPMATIRLEDSGGGIPLEVFFNVFHPFFTTKHGGTGLGLPICKKIVESHGGNIRMENHIGRGLIVYIQLPLHNICSYNDKPGTAA
jgi:signal transduction histidine kinase